MTTRNDTDPYPSVFERFKAALIDGAIMVALLLVVAGVVALLGDVSGTVRMILFLLVWPLYEPLQVWLFGQTIGHRMIGLRVTKKYELAKNPNLIQAVIRTVGKVLLGIVSIFAIPFSYRQRAIHDMLSGTLMLYDGVEYGPTLDPENAPPPPPSFTD